MDDTVYLSLCVSIRINEMLHLNRSLRLYIVHMLNPSKRMLPYPIRIIGYQLFHLIDAVNFTVLFITTPSRKITAVW